MPSDPGSGANDHRPRVDRDRLRALLDLRRGQVAEDVQRRMLRIREKGTEAAVPHDAVEADPSDLDVSLLEIAAATLDRIDDAIARLEDGRYGMCTRCDRPISEARLRAVPFAVRCQRCEAVNEREEARHRAIARKRLWSDAGHSRTHAEEP